MRRILIVAGCLALLTGVAAASAAPGSAAAPFPKAPEGGGGVRRLDLRECLKVALENNRSRPVSRLNVEIADAQLRQALSAYWPQLGLKASFSRMDEDPNFIFPSASFSTPGMTVVATTPLGPVPVTVPPMSVSIPDQNIKLMDRDNMLASLNLLYPIYTGGLRSSVARQAQSGVAAAKEEARRTDLQIGYDVKRFYFGAVLAKRLRAIAEEALARMEVTLDLTENLYKGGSVKVKKTDYLRNRTVVEGLRSVVAQVKGDERLALAALTNAIGLEWDAEIAVADEEIPYRPYETDLRSLVGSAYAFNPDWKRLEEGIKASEARVDEKSSGHLPQIALIGNLTRIENGYDKGVVTPENRNSWMAGVAMELPLFKGFRTREEVREARIRLERIRHQKVLLREGIALQVKDVFLLMTRCRDQRDAMAEAARASEENRDLNERAYQEELVETKDVIEAQLVESFMKSGREKVLYDHVESQARLEFLVGREIESALQGAR